MKPVFIVVLFVVMSLLAPWSASAQLHQDPGYECGDEPPGTQCYRCTKNLLGMDSNGNFVYQYKCEPADPSPWYNTSQDCTAGSSGCIQSNWCVVA